MRVHISTGNTKLGKVGDISLMPGLTCIPGAPCRRDCYARKFLFRKTVHKAWTDNTTLAKTEPRTYFNQVFEWIDRNKPRYFRWHVAGDILNQGYLDEMILIAKLFRDTRFLVFTKRFEFDYRDTPSNMSVLFSAWPGWQTPPRKVGVRAIAWMQDGTEIRVPIDATRCKGTCSSCFECWNATHDVMFRKH